MNFGIFYPVNNLNSFAPEMAIVLAILKRDRMTNQQNIGKTNQGELADRSHY